ncbi:hypothetical protein [Qipengyuania sphaerica]|uniref:hypothetical protein n=1 Tax=Qipengyuania sphaerica TaxID=2867243 RepID=UPI001C87DB06|nr:hypothetical protein [Qipengyuania sphaerica]MBX7540321.1 hypothetical protein [Qipengyuania sphaerica]
MRRYPAAMATSLVLVPSTGLAQQPADTNADPIVVTAPSDRFDEVFIGLTTSIDVSEKKSEANASVSGYTASDNGDPSRIEQNALMWKVGIALPIGGTDDVIKDPTLDRLANGLKLSAGLTLMSSASSLENYSDDTYAKLGVRALAACDRRAGGDAEKKRECDEMRRLPIVSPSFIRKHLPMAMIAANRAAGIPFYTIGVKGSVAFKEYEAVDPVDLGTNEDFKTAYSTTLTGVFYPADGVSAIKAEVEYADALEELDETIICKTPIGDPAVDCKSGFSALPEREESLVLRGEYRRFFPVNGVATGVGIAPLVSFDALSNDLGVEVPVYAVLGGESPIAPGLKFGYTKDGSEPSDANEEFTVSLFLKTSFSF